MSTCLEYGINYGGGDVTGLGCSQQPDTWSRENPVECLNLCKSVEGCTHFSWISPEHGWVAGRKRCCLKSAETLVPNDDDVVVSGVIAKCESSMNYTSKQFFLSLDTALDKGFYQKYLSSPRYIF